MDLSLVDPVMCVLAQFSLKEKHVPRNIEDLCRLFHDSFCNGFPVVF